MGYSTTDIDPKSALHVYRHYETTEASNERYFTSNTWKKQVVRAQISDHKPPRIIYTLANGDFVTTEVPGTLTKNPTKKTKVNIYYKDIIEMNGKGISYVTVDNERTTADKFFEYLIEDIRNALPSFYDDQIHLYIGNATAWTYDILFDATVDTDTYDDFLDANYEIQFIKI